MKNTSETVKKLYMECLRIIAVLAILYDHTGTRGMELFSVARDSPLYWFYLSFSIVIKVGVPIFFMISGALLLPRQETTVSELCRRILRILTVLVAGSLINYIYQMRSNLSNASITYFMKHLYSTRITTPYWFLYSYLSFLIVLPLLRRFAQSLSDRQFIYLIGIFLLFKGLDIVEYAGGVFHYTHISYFLSEGKAVNLFYPLLGYFLEERLPKKYYTWRNCCLMILVSILAVGICSFVVNDYAVSFDAWNEGKNIKYFDILVAVPTVTIYFGVKLWFMKHKVSNHVEKIIITLGSCTFGIYLFDGIYHDVTRWIYDTLYPYLHSFPSCLIWIAAAFAVGAMVTWVLKKIPLIRHYL